MDRFDTKDVRNIGINEKVGASELTKEGELLTSEIHKKDIYQKVSKMIEDGRTDEITSDDMALYESYVQDHERINEEKAKNNQERE